MQHARPPGPYFRDGKYLVVMNHTVLPSRCPVTNRPAAHSNPVRFRKIVWTPSASLVGLLFGRFISSTMRKRVSGRLSYPLSSGPKARMAAVRLVGCLLIAAGIGLMALCASRGKLDDGSNSDHPKTPAEISIGLGLMVAGGVAFTLVNPLRVKDHRNGWFKVTGCSRNYLAALPEYSFDWLR